MLQAQSPGPVYRLVLAVNGSRGDIYPMLSIGQEMQRRGHHVIFATPERFRPTVSEAGLEFRDLRPDTEHPEVRHLSQKERQKRASSKFALRDVMYPAVETTYRDLLHAGEGADMMLFPFFLFPGSMAAEKLGIPYSTLFFTPGQMNSRYDPPLLPPIPWMYPLQRRSPSIAGGINKLGGWAIRSWSKPLHDLRAREGFTPHRGDPVLDPPRSPWLTLALFSSCMASAKPDWPQPTVLTGFPFYEQNATHEDDSLQAFMDEGEAPLVAALGSSTSTYRSRFFVSTLEAAKRLGKRVLLIAGDAAEELRHYADGRSVFVTRYAPYSSVFSKAACVVIAGSVGPISHALRAGCPMLLVASEHAADQPDAGVRCERMGVARWLHLTQYTTDKGENLLRELLSNPLYTRNARLCAQQVAAEDGASKAVNAVEEVLAKRATMRKL